jgi:transposase
MTVPLREDFSAVEVRKLAARAQTVSQSRRLLLIAAIYDGMNRSQAARIGGMDRQTLRDWVHHFNADGPEGLHDHWTSGPSCKLSPAQLAEQAAIVEAGPDIERDGVVRWRQIDLREVIEKRFGVSYGLRAVANGCTRSASRISAPARVTRRKTLKRLRLLKKLRRRAERPHRPSCAGHAGRNLVPGRGAHRAEERPCPPVGAQGHAAQPAQRPALRQRLHLWCDLPGAGRGRSHCHALCRHRGDAGTPRGHLGKGGAGRLRRSHPRPRRLAHHRQSHHAGKHRADLPAVALAGVRGHRRRRLPGMEQADSHARKNHVHRLARMGE